MSGPGFTQRPENPGDRRNWRKPWVTWKLDRTKEWLRRREQPYIFMDSPPRGQIHDPEKTANKKARARERQSKDRR